MFWMRRRRICSAALQGSRSSKQSWIALRCSGADPSASQKPCRNTLQFAWLASGWRVAGVRWTANRDVCSGYSNSGNTQHPFSCTKAVILRKIRRLGLAPCAVADVEHFNTLLFLKDAVYHTINMRLVAIEKVPQLVSHAYYRATARMLLQAENGVLETQVPFQGSAGILGIDSTIQLCQIALSAGSDVNEICHGPRRTRRKTALPAGVFLLSRSQGPDGFLPLHRRGRQCRANADKLQRLERRPRPS